MQQRGCPPQHEAVDPFLDKKKRWPKRRRKRATSHQKRTVNLLSRGG